MAEVGAACADAAEEIDFLALQRTLPTIDENQSINQNLVEQHLASIHKKKKKKGCYCFVPSPSKTRLGMQK